MTDSLAGMHVAVTSTEAGDAAQLLEARGATVVHVPLIRLAPPSDGGVALDHALSTLDRFEWLVVTSRAGAQRIGAAARRHPGVGLAAVGSATASVLADLAGRPVDVTPDTQQGSALATVLDAHLGERRARILIAQAERADPALAEGLRDAGHEVEVVAAYRTEHQAPDPAALADVDAVLFASGSAAEAWHAALGGETPPLTVAIGPTTAAAADRIGLKISAISADHSMKGLVAELDRLVTARR